MRGDGAVERVREVNEAIGYDGFSDGFSPAAVFAEAAMGADGADDAVGGCGDVFRLLDDEFEGAAGIGGTLVIEAEGGGVTMDDLSVTQLKIGRDNGGALPVEEGFFDRIAIGMPADGAVGFVMAEADRAGPTGVRGGFRLGLAARPAFGSGRRDGLICG